MDNIHKILDMSKDELIVHAIKTELRNIELKEANSELSKENDKFRKTVKASDTELLDENKLIKHIAFKYLKVMDSTAMFKTEAERIMGRCLHLELKKAIGESVDDEV